MAKPTTKATQPKVEKSTFTWHGPVQGIELKIKDQIAFKGILIPGKDFDLPVDHELVISWKTSGLIVVAKALPPKAAKEDI